jgi:hypothetical protein
MLAKSALFALGNKLQKSLQTFLGGPPDLEATAVSRAQVSTALTSTLVHERSDEHRRRSRRGDHRHLYTVKAVTTSSCPLPHTGRGSLPRGWRNPTDSLPLGPLPGGRYPDSHLESAKKTGKPSFGLSGFPAFAGTMAVERVATGFSRR